MTNAVKQRWVPLGPYQINVEQRADGCYLMRSPDTLKPYATRVTDPLERWAQTRGDQTFLAKRGPDGQWQRLTYGQALEKVRSVAQALLDRQHLSLERPVVVLSGNDLEHAIMGLAALHVGVPYVPVSPGYSLLSKDHRTLKHVMERVTPGLVLVNDASRFAGALQAAVPAEVEVVAVSGDQANGRALTSFSDLLRTRASAAVEAAHDAVTGDTVAKLLFTSGSTKLPKAVINTHRMLCANQKQIEQCYPFVAETPPVLVDWLPWHHTAGGNYNFNMTLFNGGTLYIDDGKPTPDGLAETVRNLREISPHIYVTVPKTLEELVFAMKTDTVLRDSFFRDIKSILPAGAGLSESVRVAMDRASQDAYGESVLLTSGLGMTETSPFAISAHNRQWRAGEIGIPAPGVEVKLAPVDGKMEIRYRGPNVTPGYWRQPEETRAAFDEEGFFRSGDAGRFREADDPRSGLVFNGRIAEDFKLATGTFVNVGNLRAKLIAAAAPLVQDAVIAGHDRDELTAIIFLHAPSCAKLVGEASAADLRSLAHAPEIRDRIQAALNELASAATGSSHRIARALIAERPPSFDLGEATDKGSINQRGVLTARAADVAALYAETPPSHVLVAAS